MISIYGFIDNKRCGRVHSAAEIKWFIDNVVKGNIPDYQITAWLMAVCINGMTEEETAALTDAMKNSGDVLSLGLDKFCVDKHSTGGVGDKITLFAAPVCASCGVYVPKMSGSGLGKTGGTIDKLAAIPGLRTDLEYEDFKSAVKEVGFAVAGHSKNLVPADKRLYELRNLSATVESIPLICSSIMSKKLATGADGLLLDVKVGSGAFMKDEASAEELAVMMLKTAKAAGIKASAVLTDMDRPLGKTAGNALEVIEAIETLKGNGDADFTETAMTVTAEMLALAGKGDPAQCREMAEDAVRSGKALDTFRKMIARQGGDPKVCDDYSLFGKALYSKEIFADRSGFVEKISCDITGDAVYAAGAGRVSKEIPPDSMAGVVLDVSEGDYTEKGGRLAVLYSSDKNKLDSAAEIMSGAFTVCDKKVKKRKNIIKIIRDC